MQKVFFCIFTLNICGDKGHISHMLLENLFIIKTVMTIVQRQ